METKSELKEKLYYILKLIELGKECNEFMMDTPLNDVRNEYILQKNLLHKMEMEEIENLKFSSEIEGKFYYLSKLKLEDNENLIDKFNATTIEELKNEYKSQKDLMHNKSLVEVCEKVNFETIDKSSCVSYLIHKFESLIDADIEQRISQKV